MDAAPGRAARTTNPQQGANSSGWWSVSCVRHLDRRPGVHRGTRRTTGRTQSANLPIADGLLSWLHGATRAVATRYPRTVTCDSESRRAAASVPF